MIGWYIFPRLCLQLVWGGSFVISSVMNSSLKAASLAAAKTRSYGKGISHWSLRVGKRTLPALLLLACSGQTESCDWRRSELGRAYATSAWLWPWQTLWPHAGREEILGSQEALQILQCPVWLLPSHSFVLSFIPFWNRDNSPPSHRVICKYKENKSTEVLQDSRHIDSAVIVVFPHWIQFWSGLYLASPLQNALVTHNSTACNVWFLLSFSLPKDKFYSLYYFLWEYLPCKYITVLHTLCFDLIQESEKHNGTSEDFMHHFGCDFLM